MIVKGIIKSIDVQGNTCVVRMPSFETAGNDEIIATATVSNSPGSYNGYKVDDVVWVAFENDQLECPVIIGKLYLGIEAERADPRGTLNVVDSKISRTAEIPFDTKLGRNLEPGMPKTLAPFNSLNSIANNLSAAEVNIAQNDRDYGNRFRQTFEAIDGNKTLIDQTNEYIKNEVQSYDGDAFGWRLDTGKKDSEDNYIRKPSWRVYAKGNSAYLAGAEIWLTYRDNKYFYVLKYNGESDTSVEANITISDGNYFLDGIDTDIEYIENEVNLHKITVDKNKVLAVKLDDSENKYYWYINNIKTNLEVHETIDILTANEDGLNVTGTVTATEGKIGNFNIEPREGGWGGLYTDGYATEFKEASKLSENNETGVYIGPDGLMIGKNFSIDAYGNIKSSQLDIMSKRVNAITSSSFEDGISLPITFQRVEGLKSKKIDEKKAGYVNTGHNLNNWEAIEIKFLINDEDVVDATSIEDNFIFGCLDGAAGLALKVGKFEEGNNLALITGNTIQYYSVTTGQKHKIRIKNNQAIQIDGKEEGTAISFSSVILGDNVSEAAILPNTNINIVSVYAKNDDWSGGGTLVGKTYTAGNILIFGAKDNETIKVSENITLYSFKIFDNSNILLNYFIPAIRNADSKTGLYDVKSGSEEDIKNGTFSECQLDSGNYSELIILQNTVIYESNFSAMNDKIVSEVSRVETNLNETINSTKTEIKQTTDGISATLSETATTLQDNIDIVQENLDDSVEEINTTITNKTTEIKATTDSISLTVEQETKKLQENVEEVNNSLSSRIDQNATNISAKVSKAQGSEESEFGWNLTDNEWTIFNEDKNILLANKDGLEVSGKIEAESGHIGSFIIGDTGITSSTLVEDKETAWADNFTDEDVSSEQGIYLGTDGIKLGKKFSVDTSGNLITNSGNIGNFNIGQNGIYSDNYITSYTEDSGEKTGVYVGTDGIKLGNSFSVDNEGTVRATGLKIDLTTEQENDLRGTQTVAIQTKIANVDKDTWLDWSTSGNNVTFKVLSAEISNLRIGDIAIFSGTLPEDGRNTSINCKISSISIENNEITGKCFGWVIDGYTPQKDIDYFDGNDGHTIQNVTYYKKTNISGYSSKPTASTAPSTSVTGWKIAPPVPDSTYPYVYASTVTYTNGVADWSNATTPVLITTLDSLVSILEADGIDIITTTRDSNNNITSVNLNVDKINTATGNKLLIGQDQTVEIGGFIVNESSISNTALDSSDKSDQIVIGTEGIQLGENFSITSEGELFAAEGTFTGSIDADGATLKNVATLEMGNDTILDAQDIRAAKDITTMKKIITRDGLYFGDGNSCGIYASGANYIDQTVTFTIRTRSSVLGNNTSFKYEIVVEANRPVVEDTIISHSLATWSDSKNNSRWDISISAGTITMKAGCKSAQKSAIEVNRGKFEFNYIDAAGNSASSGGYTTPQSLIVSPTITAIDGTNGKTTKTQQILDPNGTEITSTSDRFNVNGDITLSGDITLYGDVTFNLGTSYDFSPVVSGFASTGNKYLVSFSIDIDKNKWSKKDLYIACGGSARLRNKKIDAIVVSAKADKSTFKWPTASGKEDLPESTKIASVVNAWYADWEYDSYGDPQIWVYNGQGQTGTAYVFVMLSD